jgi:PAS domain S-box-containing protein
MRGFFRNTLLFKMMLLFTSVIFVPVSIVAYIVYGLITDNHKKNTETALISGSEYINSIFEHNLNIVSGGSIKLKDDHRFKLLVENSLNDENNLQDLLAYLKSGHAIDFISIERSPGEQPLFYSDVIKIENCPETGSALYTPSLDFNGGKFIAYIKSNYTIAGSLHKIILGKLVDDYNLYELCKTLGFDFILLESHNGIYRNLFSTIFDEYGTNIERNSLSFNTEDVYRYAVFPINLAGHERKALPFSLKYSGQNRVGLVTRVETFGYIEAAKRQFLILIASFILLVIIFVVFIKRRILNPIVNLLEGIGNVTVQIENGKPIEPLDVTSKDEIGTLAEEYNKMAANLGVSFSRIKYLQNYLLNIFESMPSGLIAVDSHGKITQWNRSAEKYYKGPGHLSQGDEIWKSIPDLGIYKDELLKIIDARGHLEIYREPFTNGEKKNVNINLFPLIANGVTGSVIRIDDITELKKKEEQLIQAQKMETIGTLAGGIAHDFNNILSGIVGVVSILKYKIEKNAGFSPEDMLEYLDIMDQSGKRAGDIVQRLLTLSRKQTTSLEKVCVSEVVGHVIKLCSNSFDKRVKITGINLDSKVSAYADFTQLEQVILNLSINANHAMTIMRGDDSAWGGKLTLEITDQVSSAELKSVSGVEIDRKFIKISVRDTGIGMDTATIKQIFEPFFSTKDKNMGTGLGLTIVYNIVQLFGGYIDIESVQGQGTDFRIYLPQYDNQAELEHNDKSLSVMKGEGTILVIDDEPVLRELAKNMLGQCGYKVICANDGIEGLEIYRAAGKNIDLVLLDMMMPNLNGKDTFIALSGINPDIKVVMASGFAKDSRVEEVLELGAKDFVQKPYTIYGLSEKIYKALNDK